MDMRKLFVILVLLTLGGCGYPSATIESDPPGARISVNGNYVGEAPVKAEMKYNRMWPAIWTIDATPPAGVDGLYPQQKKINSWKGQSAPERVFFDMHVKPEGKK